MNKKSLILTASKFPIVADLTYDLPTEGNPLVVFLHGYKGFKDWGAWNIAAEKFAKSGLNFFKFNFSLNGGTVEQPIDFPDLEAFGRNTYSQELEDANYVINFAQRRFNPSEIYLIGHSRGGGIAVLTAAQNRLVKKLVTWAAVSDFGSRFPSGELLEKWRTEGVMTVTNGRTKQEMPHNYSFYKDYQNNKQRLDIKKWCNNLNIPYLILHGKEDKAVLPEDAEKLQTAYPLAKLKMLDTGHTFGTKHPWGNGDELPEAFNKVIEESVRFLK